MLIEIVLLILVVLEAFAIFLLFHHHLVNMSGWHQLLHAQLAKAQQDAAEAKAWMQNHVMHKSSVAAVENTKPVAVASQAAAH